MEIAIIGGGITGLTTALSLNKLGIKTTVYEKAPKLNEIGAGVWLQPNAMFVLKWLGLEEAIKKEGNPLNKMEIAYPNLKPIKKINSEVVADKYGNQTIAIHRGKLQKILYNEFSKVGTVKLGMDFQSHTTQNGKIRIKFKGNEVKSDVILGADGIGSKVRKSIGQPSIYRDTGQICCRGISDISLPQHLKNNGKEVWGKNRRFGFSELAENKVYFFVVLNKTIAPKKPTIENIAPFFDSFDPIINKIISNTKTLHTAELSDLKRLTTWHTDNTCLLGDAAHATTPNMGQGACQGIEDAYYIANLIKKNSNSPIVETFQQFEKERRKKVDYVVNNSWAFGKLSHSRFGQLMLRGIMKITPESVMSKQMNKLYNVSSF